MPRVSFSIHGIGHIRTDAIRKHQRADGAPFWGRTLWIHGAAPDDEVRAIQLLSEVGASALLLPGERPETA